MTVAFNNMPGDIRVPLFYAEVNAGVPPYSGLSRQILLGRRLATASGLAPLKPRNIGSTDPNFLAGRGSARRDRCRSRLALLRPPDRSAVRRRR